MKKRLDDADDLIWIKIQQNFKYFSKVLVEKGLFLFFFWSFWGLDGAPLVKDMPSIVVDEIE